MTRDEAYEALLETYDESEIDEEMIEDMMGMRL